LHDHDAAADLTGGPRSGASARAIAAVVAFGIAFGWLEAAVVVYLRELLYPQGFDFPLRLLRPDLAVIELAREASTLVMLAAVGVLGARTGWGRFGLFALAFGVWDLVYYLGLWIALGWPAGPGTWDVLFLIPGVWTGPVWTAALIAALLMAFGVPLYVRGERGALGIVRWWHWALAVISLTLILAAFLANHSLVLQQGVPVDFPEALYFAGLAAGIAAAVDLIWLHPARHAAA
jgi:hypothetical protein